MKRPTELEYLTALVNLLAVMNPDKDGGWFICEEARRTVDEAKDLLGRALNVPKLQNNLTECQNVPAGPVLSSGEQP